MNTSDFYFDLPQNLIATHPSKERGMSRLLYAGQELSDKCFTNLPEFLNSGDVLVFNNTKTIPARLYGEKTTGGKVEVTIERILPKNKARALVKSNRGLQTGSEIILAKGNIKAVVISKEKQLYLLQFESSMNLLQALEKWGEIPLPPYLHRPAETIDSTRYQTVFARHAGSVAAPTAGLHFNETLLEKIRQKNIICAELTLHIGAGTFLPVQTEKIEDHNMHYEYFELPQKTVDAILEAKKRGNRVIAVGTTSVRTLESAWRLLDGQLKQTSAETNLFISPGFSFKLVDALLTNFHLPSSTLIMLVSAFYGLDNTMKAYQYAIEKEYRFFSYGDAMYIPSRTR